MVVAPGQALGFDFGHELGDAARVAALHGDAGLGHLITHRSREAADRGLAAQLVDGFEREPNRDPNPRGDLDRGADDLLVEPGHDQAQPGVVEAFNLVERLELGPGQRTASLGDNGVALVIRARGNVREEDVSGRGHARRIYAGIPRLVTFLC